MGEIRVLNRQGDVKVEWDPADADSVTKAKKEFEQLKKDGYEFFEVSEAKGKRVERFSKKHGKLIAAPGVKTATDKKTGSRPRAQAGGPNTQVVEPVGRTRRNDDALYNRPAEPGSPEWDYLHRYDSPDNERDSMG